MGLILKESLNLLTCIQDHNSRNILMNVRFETEEYGAIINAQKYLTGHKEVLHRDMGVILDKYKII